MNTFSQRSGRQAKTQIPIKFESYAEVTVLIFVGLAKFRKPPDKKDIGDTTKIIEDWKKKGVC